jgi:hypothetical protein
MADDRDRDAPDTEEIGRAPVEEQDNADNEEDLEDVDEPDENEDVEK